jgi:hypothetical protein
MIHTALLRSEMVDVCRFLPTDTNVFRSNGDLEDNWDHLSPHLHLPTHASPLLAIPTFKGTGSW